MIQQEGEASVLSPRRRKTKKKCKANSSPSLLDSSLTGNRVRFALDPVTIIAYVENRSDIEEPQQLWFTFSDKEIEVISNKAQEFFNELAGNEQQELARGMERIYKWADIQETDSKHLAIDTNQPIPSFLRKWTSLDRDHRGMEKQVLSVLKQKVQEKKVAVIRATVLRMQKMLTKTPSQCGAPKEDVIRQKYNELSRPFVFLATVMGRADAQALTDPLITTGANDIGVVRTLSNSPVRRGRCGNTNRKARSLSRPRNGTEGLQLQREKSTRDGLLQQTKTTRNELDFGRSTAFTGVTQKTSNKKSVSRTRSTNDRAEPHRTYVSPAAC